MKLHHTAIDKIINICITYAGSPNESKIRNMLSEIDFTPYERKTSDKQDIILVTTEEYVRALKTQK